MSNARNDMNFGYIPPAQPDETPIVVCTDEGHPIATASLNLTATSGRATSELA